MFDMVDISLWYGWWPHSMLEERVDHTFYIFSAYSNFSLSMPTLSEGGITPNFAQTAMSMSGVVTLSIVSWRLPYSLSLGNQGLEPLIGSSFWTYPFVAEFIKFYFMCHFVKMWKM